MKLTYLGTAAAEGIPAVFCGCSLCGQARTLGGKNQRTRSQVLMDDTIIIDFPPDSLMHAQNQKIDFLQYKAILVTHSHQDHWYPYDLMFRRPPYSWGQTHRLEIYGNHRVEQKLNALNYLEDEAMASSIRMNYVEPYAAFMIGTHAVTPLLANHDKKEQCYIYMIESGGKRLLYAHDTGLFPEKTMQFIKGIYFDLISMDCTTGLEKDGNNHMGIADNRELEGTLRSLGCMDDESRIIVSHFSHNGGLLHGDIEKKVEDYGYIVAYDGMSIEC